LDLVDEAIDCLNRALKLDSDCLEAWENLGLAYRRNKMFLDSIDCLSRASGMVPDKTFYHQQIGQTWLMMGKEALFHSLRLEEAVNHFSRSLDYLPDNAETWYKKGITLKKLGSYSEA